MEKITDIQSQILQKLGVKVGDSSISPALRTIVQVIDISA